jgi:hypothetical protein
MLEGEKITLVPVWLPVSLLLHTQELEQLHGFVLGFGDEEFVLGFGDEEF